MYISHIKNFIAVILFLFFTTLNGFAQESASAEFNFSIPEYVKIEPITSPVLVANITDKTGNLHAPLATKFRVITNSSETKKLFLKSNIITDSGFEESMFEIGGRVYIAFGNLAKIPSSQALISCKTGGAPQDSAGVVAYPITSIHGAKSEFIKSKQKYEVQIENGTTYVTVNVGANVFKNSFSSNDPKGFYQAILSLTEADI